MKKILASCFIIALIAGCNCNNKKTTHTTTGGADTGYTDISELPDSAKTAPMPDSTPATPPQSVNTDLVTSGTDNKDSALRTATSNVFAAIKNKDYNRLSAMVHPQDGVRFSPYATVDPGTDRTFSQEDVVKLFTVNKNKRYTWGSYDGSGNPINKTATEYFTGFVYDKNYAAPGKLSVNKQIGKGNSINNIKSNYPGGDYTESHFSGSKKYSGMDWKSVRLVFKPYNGKYYLVGVVHDGWTI